jgi:hypothetical protein
VNSQFGDFEQVNGLVDRSGHDDSHTECRGLIPNTATGVAFSLAHGLATVISNKRGYRSVHHGLALWSR